MCVCVCVCDGENLMHIVLRKKVVSLLDLVLNFSLFSFSNSVTCYFKRLCSVTH